jgi:hypothetical protein
MSPRNELELLVGVTVGHWYAMLGPPIMELTFEIVTAGPCVYLAELRRKDFARICIERAKAPVAYL